MSRPEWFVNILKKCFPRAKILTYLTRMPIFKKIFELSSKEDKLITITQDKTIIINHKIEKLNDMILPSKVVEYFIERANHHVIMNFCICRDSKKCDNYPSKLGCLFMGEAVLGINPKIGRRVSKDEALEHIKKCREEGLIHTIGRNKLDAFWLGVGPENKLLTVCNCCPCCCIAQYIPQTTRKINKVAEKMVGVNVRVTDACKGCGLCTKNVCVFNAISLINNQAFINSNCRGCGRCVTICPQNAIELTLNDDLYITKTIKKVEKLVDLSSN